MTRAYVWTQGIQIRLWFNFLFRIFGLDYCSSVDFSEFDKCNVQVRFLGNR